MKRTREKIRIKKKYFKNEKKKKKNPLCNEYIEKYKDLKINID